MKAKRKLLDEYLPPEEADFVLESLVATTYNVQWDFVEEELLALALGVKAPTSRQRAFRSEIERKLATCTVSVLFDPRGCEHVARTSPRIDAIPTDPYRKQHSKISLLSFVRKARTGSGLERRLRLIIGSANLTRQGFRENLEVVSVFDFNGKDAAPRSLLVSAIALIRDIAGSVATDQLRQQLEAFTTAASQLPSSSSQHSVRLVGAEDVIAELARAWRAVNAGKASVPDALTIVSPFWPSGKTSSTAVLKAAIDLHSPKRVELVCCGELAPDASKIIPVLPADLVKGLRSAEGVKVCVRPARPTEPPEVLDTNDEEPSEDDELGKSRAPSPGTRGNQENRRPLHAKILALTGSQGAAVYIGSSNCTRRGLAQLSAGASNWEAGVIYQLRGRAAQTLESLWNFASQPVELAPQTDLQTIEPEAIKEAAFPSFIMDMMVDAQVVITIALRNGKRPATCEITMLDVRHPDRTYVLHSGELPSGEFIRVAAAECPSRVGETALSPNASAKLENVNTTATVAWDGFTAQFPLRFENKAALPPTPWSRQPTEAELIEYFLTGRQPWEEDEFTALSAATGTPTGSETERGVDTSSILSYQMRTFVDALFGMEDTIMESARSRAALHSTLFGHTSALSLARQAVESLKLGTSMRPVKTAVAVGFQLVEIKGVIDRCRRPEQEKELADELEAAAADCEQMLSALASEYQQLRKAPFTSYRRTIAGVRS